MGKFASCPEGKGYLLVDICDMKAPNNFNPEPFEYHQEIELVIEDVTNLGQGVGRVDGWVVFVPFALPGERVLIRIWRNKKQYSDADLVRIIEASPDRVEPVCPLFGTCGGCQYQHYGYSAQLEWKRRQIEQLIRKMAGLSVPVNPCLGDSAHTYGYRSKITPHFRRPPHIPGTPIGFQKAASRAIIDVSHCPIASPAINEALPAMLARLRKDHGAYRRGATLLLRDCREGVVTDMKAVVSECVGEMTFNFAAGEFFQNNPHMLPRMVDYALDQAAQPGIRFLVDAYCGVGVFGICGHHRFEQVAGIEVNDRAISLAQENAALNKIPNISFQLGSAEAIFSELTFDPSQTAVLLDPPRKGCDPGFIEQLLAYGPARIVYVSCGPDTQARDLKLLVDSGAYRVEDVQPVDLFPQNRHIENIVTLARIA
jgi:23S rRNA (uracil1939-C5)-methyltransferase/tRNA (uracil-5-)-methyltransferase